MSEGILTFVPFLKKCVKSLSSTFEPKVKKLKIPRYVVILRVDPIENNF